MPDFLLDYCIAIAMMAVPVVLGILPHIFFSLVLHVRNRMGY